MSKPATFGNWPRSTRRKIAKLQRERLLSGHPFETGLQELAFGAMHIKPVAVGVPGLRDVTRVLPRVGTSPALRSTSTSRLHAYDVENFEGWLHQAGKNYTLGDESPDGFLGDFIAFGPDASRAIGDNTPVRERFDDPTSDILGDDEDADRPIMMQFEGVRIQRRRGILRLLVLSTPSDTLSIYLITAAGYNLGVPIKTSEGEFDPDAEPGPTERLLPQRHGTYVEIDLTRERDITRGAALSWTAGHPFYTMIGASSDTGATEATYNEAERDIADILLDAARLRMRGCRDAACANMGDRCILSTHQL